VDQLLARRGLVHSANGGQEGRGGRLADPGEWHQAWVVRAMGKQRQSLVAPAVLCGQGVDEIGCEHCARELVKTRRVWETATSGGQVLDALGGLRTPLPTTLAGLPRVQQVGTAVA
jgi:hypothetical protein